MAATKKRRVAPTSSGISGQLREIIHRRGLKAYSIAMDAGLQPSVIGALNTLASLDAIADALGLRLIEKGKGRPKPDEPMGPSPTMPVSVLTGD
jgi:hypothetical protein